MFHYKVNGELELRLFELRHAEILFALVEQNRDRLRAWLSWVDDSQSSQDTEKFIINSLQEFTSERGFAAGIWFHNQLVGSIGLHDISWSDRKATIGYWLSETVEGKGIMTNACRAIINYAFQELKLHRMTIRVQPENHRSRAIPERLGFQKEGILRQDNWMYDRYIDLIVYGLLADEWQCDRAGSLGIVVETAR
ncbi:MAG: GNAT family N-acetyltransferase [Leptolyngbyaceae cyanobacterium SM1_3_5]|nr:GNAT family N-acetyltransferase [Leptolyngbyaceae cyanobacterium SM1_3_5]